MSSMKPDDALRLVSVRSETLLWALFIMFATATQLAFKWAGTELEGQELGLGFVGAAAIPDACGCRPAAGKRDGGVGAANPPGTKPGGRGAETKPLEG